MIALVVPATKCHDFQRASRLEWLETDGLGGYAMGTVAGANTRRYHGHWVTALRPGEERMVALSKLEESVGDVELSANQYPGAIHPRGFEKLVDFRIDPFPHWTFDCNGVRVEKELFLVRGVRGSFVRYRANAKCTLRVRPMFSLRGYHALRGKPLRAVPSAREVAMYDGEARLFSLRFSAGRFVEQPLVNRNVEYLVELDRGFEFREDLFSPGFFELELHPDRSAWVIASDQEIGLDEGERARRAATPLERAADAFFIERSGQPSIIAGYPWFTDWGRDAMISLPGLLVARGRYREARGVLATFLRHLDRGLIPNRFPDEGGRPETNTADATLWLFQAAEAYVAATDDVDFLRETLLPAAIEIVEHHIAGTHHQIGVDPNDQLLSAGGPDDNLTWMDARVDGKPVIARHGKAVEINALWYDALRLLQRWGEDRFAGRASQVARSFAQTFWNPARECLYDVVRDDHRDARIRPNQILAVAIHNPLMDRHQQRSIVDVVEKHLLTPFGLRTLAPGEPGYAPRYDGDGRKRDAAYHQGTVWPWLLGPFVRAYLRVHGRNATTRWRVRAMIEPLIARCDSEGCLGNIPEVFDAEPPYRAGGTPAQAWSVAELLSLLDFELRA
ncbi:MAG: amylo-alpha-1,6-glucosidase [Polyangiales bacterium]